MEEFYEKPDAWYSDYYIAHPDQRSAIKEAMFPGLFAANYHPEMEHIFLRAMEQPMTEAQKQRLELMEMNLIVLQGRLRNAAYLSADLQSPLRRDSEQVAELLTRDNEAFALFPSAVRTDDPKAPKYLEPESGWRVQFVSPLPNTPEKRANSLG